MFPRNPFLFRLTTTCAIIFLIGSAFYSNEVLVDLPVERFSQPGKFISGDLLTFRINQEPCTDDVYLAIYIHSKPENVERRRVIRYSWGADHVMKKLKARLVFITGIPGNQTVEEMLRRENRVYKDIVQAVYIDTYRNLTYKAISGLKWLTERCPNSQFVLKSDDDMVINIYDLADKMKTNLVNTFGSSNILMCHTWDKMDVVRNTSSKWYTSKEEYPDDYFLRYCSGSAFFMTSDVAKKLYAKSKEIPFFWIDDYYVTGMVAGALGINAISYNKKYIVEDFINIKEALTRDRESKKVMFVHSPNTSMSVYVWKTFLHR